MRVVGGVRAAFVLAAFVVLSNTRSHAVEGGTSPYLKGSTGFMAGMLPIKGGLYVNALDYHVSGATGTEVRNGRVELAADKAVNALLLEATYVTDFYLLGGQYAFGGLAGYASAKLDATVSAPSGFVRASPENDSISDSMVTPMLVGWHTPLLHYTAGLSIYVPAGLYNRGTLNLGRNVWALIPKFGATYFDSDSGWDVSGVGALVFQGRNDATDYSSGDLFHLDWAVGKHLGGWELGVAGNWMYQLTGDTGSGARLGSFRAESFGLGPALSYSGVAGALPFNLSAKWSTDIAAKNTFKGDVVTVAATLIF